METTDPKGEKMGQIFLQDNRISMSTKVRDKLSTRNKRTRVWAFFEIQPLETV